MTITKSLSAILHLVIVATMFVSCGSSNSQEPQETETIQTEIQRIYDVPSLIGKNIRLGNLFTINVLASSQISLAKKYSKEREPDLLSDETWNISDGFPKIQGARVYLECELAKVYESHAANIFVGSINKYFGDLNQSALIYDARDYGRFNPLN